MSRTTETIRRMSIQWSGCAKNIGWGPYSVSKNYGFRKSLLKIVLIMIFRREFFSPITLTDRKYCGVAAPLVLNISTK